VHSGFDYESWVDGSRVTFHRRTGWTCDCGAFRVLGECEHAIKAAALLTWGWSMTSREEVRSQKSMDTHLLAHSRAK